MSERVGALIGGVAAAAEHGELLAADEHADVYLARSAFAYLASFVAFVPDSLGLVVLRIVDDEACAIIPAGMIAPRGRRWAKDCCAVGRTEPSRRQVPTRAGVGSPRTTQRPSR